VTVGRLAKSAWNELSSSNLLGRFPGNPAKGKFLCCEEARGDSLACCWGIAIERAAEAFGVANRPRRSFGRSYLWPRAERTGSVMSPGRADPSGRNGTEAHSGAGQAPDASRTAALAPDLSVGRLQTDCCEDRVRSGIRPLPDPPANGPRSRRHSSPRSTKNAFLSIGLRSATNPA